MSQGNSTEIQPLLDAWRQGDIAARERVFELMYADLRRIAAAHMRRERPDHTLQATALVHEVYLRLFSRSAVDFKDRAHLLAVAARQVRRILLNHARDLHAAKRGGDAIKLSLEDLHEFGRQPHDLLLLDVVLKRLAHVDPRAAETVELRYFGGLTEAETAEVLGTSVATVKRDWNFARVWLLRQLESVHAG